MLNRAVALIPSTPIGAAVTAIIGETIRVPPWAKALSVQAQFTYGSGGTNAKFWVQTTLDEGSTWIDIMCFAFLVATARVVNSVRVATAVGANYTATDGTLADNTIKDGLLGDQVRVKYTTTGTYATTTVKLLGVFNG